MVIIGAFICSRHEPTLSKYLIVAFSFLIGGIMLEVTKNTGVVYNSDYALKLGHASEAIILAFALAVRFKLNDEYTQNLALERLLNLNQLKDQYNAELEKTVSVRTAELNISNKNLNDSIYYARHIQYSLPENFIYYKAKDIISGDFYWFEKVENKLIIAVVDCTGHGVPGAFMSMLGSTILRQIVKINKITYPGKVLEVLDHEIRSTLKQSYEDPFNKYGMDVSIVCYNMKSFTLEFAGAKRPLYHFSNMKALTVYKGSKFSIGGDVLEMADPKEFCSQSIPLKRGDSVYLFTDGIIDQFGGENNRKFMAKKFKEELVQIQDLPMSVQGGKIEARIEGWRGNYEQVDDILVMGLRF
jgi:serine phosphatase RsbU (regulator of sigma subunit)